jgi:hypothetical protein
MLTSTIAGMYRCRVQKADSEVAGQQIRHECAAKWKGFTWLGLLRLPQLVGASVVRGERALLTRTDDCDRRNRDC